MDLSIYLTPSRVRPQPKMEGEEMNDLVGNHIALYTTISDEDFDKCNIAIVGVCDDRACSSNKGCGVTPDEVRSQFYKLALGNERTKLVDMGNIMPGATIQDTYYALVEIIAFLNKKKIVPLVIGGGHDITFAMYRAYEKLEQTVNITTVDRKFDLGKPDDEINNHNFLTKIVLHQPNFLFNYTNIGTQSHFVDSGTLSFIEKLYFDHLRLGELHNDITLAEPLIRSADIFSFDCGAIRRADCPGNTFVSPNGLFGEEACRLMRYAGMSDKISCAGIFEINTLIDNSGHSAALAAQMLWYFVEGYAARKNDFPHLEKSTYLKFRVNSEQAKTEIIFYKSPKSDRWWMEVPYPPDKRLKFERHHLVSCNYADYEAACKDEIPDLWWKTFHKLS
ncbi:MAG TPA: formimidoylglutamase [Flavobacteriales bacterium]|nr:formimidoylglutamase [Flavobacteriales bacterium]